MILRNSQIKDKNLWKRLKLHQKKGDHSPEL